MVRSYVSVLNIPCICSRARVALLCDPIAWIADGCMPCYNFAIRSAQFSRRLSFGEGLFLSSLRAWRWSLSVFPRVTFVENFGDWFFSISRNRYFLCEEFSHSECYPNLCFLGRNERVVRSRRERSDDEQWLSTRACRAIFNWFTYHASCMYRIG